MPRRQMEMSDCIVKKIKIARTCCDSDGHVFLYDDLDSAIQKLAVLDLHLLAVGRDHQVLKWKWYVYSTIFDI